jgi:hypothetical protein
MPAAPTPWRARPRRRTAKPASRDDGEEVGAAVHRAEPMEMMAIEAWSVKCRPKISASWAQKGRNAAAVRLKEEIIQLSWGSWSVFYFFWEVSVIICQDVLKRDGTRWKVVTCTYRGGKGCERG